MKIFWCALLLIKDKYFAINNQNKNDIYFEKLMNILLICRSFP
jgi:hypothetical protein